MKIIKYLLILSLFAIIAGLGYFSFTDIDIVQHETSKEIPNERLFKN